MHTTNLQADGDYVDEIPGPVVVDQILHKRVIMDEVWIVSESPCTDQLEHRTEAQPSHQKKSTEVDDSSGGEEISDMNDVNYEPDYEPKVGSKKERGRSPNAQSASVLSGSDDDRRCI